MTNIKINDLTPFTEEIKVTHKIGDKSVRQYVKEHNVVQDIASMLIQGFSHDAIKEVLIDDLYDTQGSKAEMLANEVFDIAIEDANALAREGEESCKEYDAEKRNSYNELVGGTF